ncbi:GAF domain-containing protein [Dyadobacter flavalbus]|uniref:GAF domain-containing protein n=1 Tax=Dyadobacter flavalbus TaxID=2579942 RepID=A0A5M8R3X0_9BACT|nr:histidine kinase [Dyadobacter flavalbus]KAA6440852.1 GAF domain-containing protein [Dyadobacter flavalbus]
MIRKVLICLLFLFSYTSTFAQFVFQNIREEDGLSAKEVRSLYSDKDGFLWIGTTNGLNRFDGATVKQYMGFRNEKNIFITSILPLSNNKEFMLGTNKGVAIFNKQTGEFYRNKEYTSIENEIILTIKADHRNRIWILTSKTVFLYANGKLNEAKALIPSAAVIRNKHYSSLAFIWDPHRKGFWLGGSNTYFIDCARDMVFSKEHNPSGIPVLEKSEVFAIAVDKHADVWYGSDKESSLSFWNHKTNQVTTYYELDGITLNGFNNIFIDSKERIWVSTYLFAGFLKVPGQPFRKIPYSQNQKYSIGYGFFNEAIEDPEGNVWLGTINGVSKNPIIAPLQAIYELPSFKSFLETGFSHANSIVIDGPHLIACKADGIIKYNMVTRTYERYAITRKKDLIQNSFDKAVKLNKTWWFAGYDGIYTLNGKSLRRFEKVKKAPAPFIFTDHIGNIWFQIWNDAIYRYNPQTKKCLRFDGKDPKYGFFNYENVLGYLVTKRGDILFAMKGVGILKFNTATEHFSIAKMANANDFETLSSSMLEDNEGNIWVCIKNRGVIKINQQGVYLDSMNTGNGLPSDNVSSIAMDGRGFIWAATREGLVFFNPTTKEVTNVDIDFGKTLQNYWNYVTFANGKIYLVMLDQVVEINPHLFSRISVKQPPHITSVRIFEKEHVFDTKEILQLEPDQNYIKFQYSSLNHRDIPSLQYSYQLQGIDNKWINSGRSLVAAYNNIPPGKYIFKVRSTDANGKWMKTATTLQINILPYWWQTWWFLTILAVLVAILLGVWYRQYLRNKQKLIVDNTINYFIDSVYGGNTLNEICWDIARTCSMQLHFEDCSVYLFNSKRKLLIQKSLYGLKNTKVHELVNPIETEIGQGVVGTAAAVRKAVVVPDFSKDKRYIAVDPSKRSEVSVPILHEGNLLGVIDSEHSRRNFFNEEHVRALTAIASISANKIAEAQARDQALDKERMLLEINRMLADSQLMALRAQMNPHFVFNCLNSIQECIITEKYPEASKYLNKFSKLFRMVLNNSDKNLVTIKEEEDVLHLYLQLEQMRFENSFSYQILVDDELETEEIVLPSMLLQPYVENALWHGLMHKDGDRTLTISFNKINEDIFECRIEDNGIGRKKSYEIKEYNSKVKRHKSKGLQISKDRLDILQKQGECTLNCVRI